MAETRPVKMEVDSILAGELADDERTETERSPVTENLPNLPPQDDGDKSADDEDSAKRCNGKKHRRGKNKGGKRHWKPYNKLSWEERKALEDRESKRAQRKRQERFENGQPMAPYNTTQFLMEQHEADDPDYVVDENGARRLRDGSGSLDSGSDEIYDSPEDETLFMTKDFSETYNNVHAERLQNMSKEELIRELLELETKVERLERKSESNDSKDSDEKSSQNLPAENSIDIRSAASMDMEVRRLRKENERLRQENVKLKSEGSRSPNA